MSRINPNEIESVVRREAREAGISRVLVALSGGADSVAVAYSLHKSGMEIRALHCNFHLRGNESDRDMSFVESFCSAHSIPLEIIHFDVIRHINDNKGLSVEMACRELRHEWFREKLRETGFQRIATGHNADDNIETFFLNALRGSGSRGLRGMDKDTGIIWRPLLSFHRNEILDYLKDNRLEFVVDSSNLENDYRRNILRNKIIPLMKEEWKGFDSALDKTINNLRDENRLVESVIQASLPSAGSPLSVEVILECPSPILLIKRFIDKAEPFAVTPLEIMSAIKANKPHIRRWRLRKGAVFLRNGRLFIEMIHGEGSA